MLPRPPGPCKVELLSPACFLMSLTSELQTPANAPHWQSLGTVVASLLQKDLESESTSKIHDKRGFSKYRKSP